MTHSDDEKTFDLDDLFATARSEMPQPDDALFAAILADAQSVLADTQAVTSPVLETLPWYKQLWSDMGGWPSFVGLTTAGLVGVWIGISADQLPTQTINPFSASAELTDPFSGLDLGLLEG